MLISLHDMSKPIFWLNKKNILKCGLLKFLPSMLSVKLSSTKLADLYQIVCADFEYDR